MATIGRFRALVLEKMASGTFRLMAIGRNRSEVWECVSTSADCESCGIPPLFVGMGFEIEIDVTNSIRTYRLSSVAPVIRKPLNARERLQYYRLVSGSRTCQMHARVSLLERNHSRRSSNDSIGTNTSIH